jgi:diadenylate cyclase
MLRVLTALIEISALSILFYYTLIFIRATGAVQALKGLFILGLIVAFAKILRLEVLFSIFVYFLPYLFLALVIIFQSEIRRALAELGRRRIFSTAPVEERVIYEIVGAVLELSRRKIGALIALMGDIGLGNWIPSGVRLDSRVSKELLLSIFMPQGPLHDGGVIIEGDKIRAAACLFPFSKRRRSSVGLGMRHKAALGLAEASDALVIVVSEETGTISVAFRARLVRNLEEEGLRKLLEKNIHFKKKQ